jgi:hypothetical protein
VRHHARTVDTQTVPHLPALPSSGPRTDLGRVAMILIGIWAALGVAWGSVTLFQSLFMAVQLGDPMVGPRWSDPLPLGVSLAVFVGWVLSLNLLVPGVALGIAAICHDRRLILFRVLSLMLVIAAGVVATFWVNSRGADEIPSGVGLSRFFDGGQLDALGISLSALVPALVAAALILHRWEPRRPIG